MKLQDKLKIDLKTGLRVETVSPFEFGEDIIEVPCLESFYQPKWDGEKWVEGATQEYLDSLIPQDTIESLKAQLESTDYKIIKCMEYQLAGLPLPYDIEILHLQRQALRDEIGALQNGIL